MKRTGASSMHAAVKGLCTVCVTPTHPIPRLASESVSKPATFQGSRRTTPRPTDWATRDRRTLVEQSQWQQREHPTSAQTVVSPQICLSANAGTYAGTERTSVSSYATLFDGEEYRETLPAAPPAPPAPQIPPRLTGLASSLATQVKRRSRKVTPLRSALVLRLAWHARQSAPGEAFRSSTASSKTGAINIRQAAANSTSPLRWRRPRSTQALTRPMNGDAFKGKAHAGTRQAHGMPFVLRWPLEGFEEWLDRKLRVPQALTVRVLAGKGLGIVELYPSPWSRRRFRFMPCGDNSPEAPNFGISRHGCGGRSYPTFGTPRRHGTIGDSKCHPPLAFAPCCTFTWKDGDEPSAAETGPAWNVSMATRELVSLTMSISPSGCDIGPNEKRDKKNSYVGKQTPNCSEQM
ncbi:hypothetical protein BU16DRAFT_578822 [Lophium mytilinum]|uniref:Uncharacterized protein n=1 Tax=Lophium mytilinum TaxID=390894 RepID=A0A6A6R3S1_9PEZI|nr:hypothetical protein BU16DRAFT_578822 [Lophium mytilinum]